MKRFAILLFAVIMVICSVPLTFAKAASLTLVFSGETNVKPGETYIYRYKITSSDVVGYKINFRCSGIFTSIIGRTKDEKDYISQSEYVTEGTVTVTVRADAAPGATGTLTAAGRYLYFEGKSAPNKEVNASITATIAAPTPTPTPTSTPTPVPLPSVTPVYEAAPSVEPSPTPTLSARPAKTHEPSQSNSPSFESAATSAPEFPAPDIFTTDAQLPDEWHHIARQLDTLESGSMLAVTMPLAGTVPYTLLRALKAKECALTLNFDGYSLFIDGIMLGNLTDVEGTLPLEVSFSKDPEMSNAAGGNDIYQLHFSHKGELPGLFVLSFATTQNEPQDELYLYGYYGLSGQIEYKQTATVQQDGSVRFNIYSGSDYIITNTPINGIPASRVNDTIKQSPDLLTFIVPIILCAAAAAGISYMRVQRIGLFRKKRKRRSVEDDL